MEVKDVIDILVPLISDFVYILFNLCIIYVILALIRVRICFIEVLNNSFKHCVWLCLLRNLINYIKVYLLDDK